MSKFVRKTIVAVKVESTPGTDIVPGAGDCVQVRNPVITPLEMTYAERKIVRGFYGNYDALPTLKKVKVAFEVELQGSGTLGVAPAYDGLLQACGCSSVLTPPSTPTNSAFSTTTTGGTLANATYYYRVSAVYPGGESLASAETSQVTSGAGTSTVTVNWGSVAGATGYNVYGRTTGAELLLARVNGGLLTFIDTGALTPAGALPSAASGGVGYGPLSGTGKTVSMYYFVDGVRHKVVFGRGNCTAKLKANDIPFYAFDFIGLDTGADDTSNLVPSSFANYLTPLAANKLNTPTATLFGTAVALESLDLNFGNQNEQISRVGSEQILHTDRKSIGSVMIEMTSIATKDWLTQVKNATLGALNLVHGTVAGKIMTINAQNVELQTPQFSEIQGIQMVQFALRFNPTNAGNDEWSIANT